MKKYALFLFIAVIFFNSVEKKAPIPQKTSIFPIEYAETIEKINEKTQIPPKILFNLITRESQWDENLVSKNTNGTFDYGLMQINSKYVYFFSKKYLGVEYIRPLNVEENLTLGMFHLRWLYNKTGNWYDAVCAYNAGLSCVRKGRIPKSTRDAANAIFEFKE